VKTVYSHLHSFIDNYERGMKSAADPLLWKRKIGEMATATKQWSFFGHVGAKQRQPKGFELIKEPLTGKDATTSLNPLD
jgi:hypothetical protein